MEIFRSKYQDLANERRLFQEQVDLLSSLEGFMRLTDKQQQLIVLSLYLQKRAERDRDYHRQSEYFAANYVFKKPVGLKYHETRRHILNWHCHGAVWALENEGFGLEPPDSCQSHFFYTQYEHIEDYFYLQDLIKKQPYPLIGHISENLPIRNGEDDILHSCLILGEDENGKIVVWDKEGFGYPYRLTYLSEVFREYFSHEENICWGLRKIRR